MKKFQLSRFSDAIEEKYGEQSDDEQAAELTESGEDSDENMSDYEESLNGNDNDPKCVGGSMIKTGVEDAETHDETVRNTPASDKMDVDDDSSWRPTNQQKWYITNEVNQLDGARLRMVFNILRNKVPVVKVYIGKCQASWVIDR